MLFIMFVVVGHFCSCLGLGSGLALANPPGFKGFTTFTTTFRRYPWGRKIGLGGVGGESEVRQGPR